VEGARRRGRPTAAAAGEEGKGFESGGVCARADLGCFQQTSDADAERSGSTGQGEFVRLHGQLLGLSFRVFH
jgi:hypothetical protein